jgi:YVTN family beta-propeller protein
LGSPKQRALLGFLLLHANELVPRERLIEELWGEAAPATVNAALNVYLSKLRRLLADGDGDQVLATQPPGYVLRVRPERLDARRFEALLEQGREALAGGDAQQAAATLRAALSLWRGPPLADLAYEPFAQAETRRLEELRVAALEDRIEADLALGRHDALVAELETLVAENPYRERLQGQRMLALYRSGRQAEALDAYRRARRTLADELGIDPGPRLAELERAILRQDASLDAPSLPHVEREGKRRRTRWKVALAAGLVLALAIAIGLVAVLRDSSPVPPKPVVLRGDSVAVIDPATTSIVGEIPVGARPSGIAVGAGSVWVGNRDDNTLLRIDPRSRKVIRRIGLAVEPRVVVIAAESVWVASPAGDEVLRVDPAVNEVVGGIQLEQGREPCCELDLVAGGGAVWVSHHGRLSRIDPTTNTAETRREAGAKSIAYGHGSLWAMTATSRIERIDPNTNAVLDSISPERLGQIDWGEGTLAAGAGAVWTSTVVTGTLWRIDPATGHFAGRVRLGRPPVGIAFGEGAIWVVGNDATLLRVDPNSETVARTIPLGVYAAQSGTSAPLAVGEGAVWIPVTR